MQNCIDEKFEAGVYSFRDLQSLGFVKDRTDLHRKQRRYGFPLPVKLGERQAAFLRREVLGWVRNAQQRRVNETAGRPWGKAPAGKCWR